MSAVVLSYDMTWGIATPDDTRFRRMVRTNLLVALILGISIPFLPLPEIAQPTVEETPRRAQLIFEKQEIVKPPPPKPVPKKPAHTIYAPRAPIPICSLIGSKKKWRPIPKAVTR